ncbi:uncharacterized protein LOC141986208 [Natator depressus]|uniref:uncharacterized protein LOC141986208 n=1 Tax=Natator depressus TaxID=27790 RepID=UPI003EBB3158
MTESTAQQKMELARFQAEEKQKEHERQIELMQLEKEVQEAAHRREMEARKHVEEEKEKERKHVEEEKEKERKHVEEEKEKERKHVEEEKEKERKHALEMEKVKAQQNIPTNPSNPSPGTTPHPRKFPTYKAGDDTEAFLENFERACLGYNISTDQYMVELRPQLSGPLAEVAAEMPKEHMNKYELFKSKARVRMGITPEQSRRRFRALRWKPDVSFTRHAYHIVKHWDAWISGASAKLPVQYKGWSGTWTFAVYDDYPIPMLLGEDLANHVKQAKRVGTVTRSQAKQAVRPSSVPETSIRTRSEVMDPDPRPMSATAVVDPVPETQTEPVPEPEPAEQPTPDPLPALNPVLATSTPEGPTDPELVAADNPTQEAEPEPESQHSAPAESGSQQPLSDSHDILSELEGNMKYLNVGLIG